MAFDEVRLPDNVERGAKGGHNFKTIVLTVASGAEKRREVWSRARGEWDVGYGIDDDEAFQAVVAFFLGRRGKSRGFRFKDWSDYTLSNELIGTGTGVQTAFQIAKSYDAANPYTREIRKVVSGTLSVVVNSVAQTEGVDFTADYNTGILTFISIPASGHEVRVTCEFDVPVRFDEDGLEVTLEQFNAGTIPNFPIIETRDFQ